MRKILGYLSPEDHERYLHNYARAMLALGGYPNWSLEEATQALIDDQLLLRELRERYDIPAEESVDFSLYDGAICEDNE